MGADAAVAAQVRMTRLLVRAGAARLSTKGMEPYLASELTWLADSKTRGRLT